jgi:hypothetical protein
MVSPTPPEPLDEPLGVTCLLVTPELVDGGVHSGAALPVLETETGLRSVEMRDARPCAEIEDGLLV